MLRNDRPRVLAMDDGCMDRTETTVAGRSESVFAPGCPRQIFGADALWVTPGGGQLRRRGQSMLAISCSLRGGGYAQDNCYWQIVMSVISHDHDRAPAAAQQRRRRKRRRVYARARACACVFPVHKGRLCDFRERNENSISRNYWLIRWWKNDKICVSLRVINFCFLPRVFGFFSRRL